jgi:imidazolonepropionase
MSSTAVTGIGELVTCDGTGPERLGLRSNAALVIEDSVIVWIGSAADAPAADNRIDVGGRVIVPGFVDSHSHLIFAGDRATEFAARMTGQPYDGGGIGVTVAATRAATEAKLTGLLAARIRELRALGTTTIEIKSGYGLTVADELRSIQLRNHFSGRPRGTGRVCPRPGGICRSCHWGDAARGGSVRTLD